MLKKTPLIMIVEDEGVLLQTIAQKLKLKGYETISCVSGQQCLDYFQNLTVLPDAIWLDYYLDGSFNALTLMSELKKNVKWQDIPTIIVSNSASKDKVDAMLALGAKKYVLKAEHKLAEVVDMFRELLTIDE